MRNYYLLLFLLTFLTACVTDDAGDAESIKIELLPVTSVEIPDPFIHTQKNEIKVFYNRPTDCTTFRQPIITYDNATRTDNGNTRTVQLEGRIYENNCNVLNTTEYFSYLESLTRGETVIYKFFTGYDNNKQPTYIRKVVTAE